MPRYQVTIRYGERFQRYHTLSVECADVAEAMRSAADTVPPEILPLADLVELRVAPDPEARGPVTPE
jgi:hypothetical protein